MPVRYRRGSDRHLDQLGVGCLMTDEGNRKDSHERTVPVLVLAHSTCLFGLRPSPNSLERLACDQPDVEDRPRLVAVAQPPVQSSACALVKGITVDKIRPRPPSPPAKDKAD